VGTFADFQALVLKNHLQINDAFGLERGNIVRFWPNALAATAVFQLTSESQLTA
jgi:hypothetical protein